MLASLSIRDVVLIDQLNLSLEKGLNVLTGETGAGKSILLDSLGLALGMRADRSLVRSGAEMGAVIAEFIVDANHPACLRLGEEGLDADGGVLLMRRQITTDGRSRAWVNDQPISAALLKTLGDSLVEIHGQHDDRGLLEAAAHRDLLDHFGGHGALLDTTKQSWNALKQARTALDHAIEDMENARQDEEWLRHSVTEIDKFSPEEGEERELAERRAIMMQGERLSGELKDMIKDLSGAKGAEAALNGVLRKLGRMDTEAQTLLESVINSLERASIELGEGTQALESIHSHMEFDPTELEDTEERLFDLRALARKHNCIVDDLAALQDRLQERLHAVDAGDQLVSEAKAVVVKAQAKMVMAVTALHKARMSAAKQLDSEVMTELPPLKLEKATFRTVVETVGEDAWSDHGGDQVFFEISTNPGAPFGPLVKVASGGEMARFILALKVVLARKGSAPVLVFDEVDRGIGGATADAVGERLKRLADEAQVLVVTHSPQVAARGHAHYKIHKTVLESNGSEYTRTSVSLIATEDRTDEIARMLAGAEVTTEARAAADRLLASG